MRFRTILSRVRGNSASNDHAPATGVDVGVRIAFVDSRRILEQTPGYALADSQFTRELESWRAEIQRLQAGLDSAAVDLDHDAMLLSADALDAKRQNLIQQQTALEQRAAALEERAGQRQRELLDPIEQRVNAAIESVRAAHSYAMIFDVGVPVNGVVAADRSLDLTQSVVDELATSAE